MSLQRTIDGVTVNYAASPYAAGHVLNEAEASVLNQTFFENVRNNVVSRAKRLREAGEPVDLQALVDKYAAEYEFGVRAAGASRVTDPIEVETLLLIKNAIKAKLKADGKVAKADKIAEAAKAILADPDKSAKFRKKAEKNVAEARKMADESLADLNLDEAA